MAARCLFWDARWKRERSLFSKSEQYSCRFAIATSSPAAGWPGPAFPTSSSSANDPEPHTAPRVSPVHTAPSYALSLWVPAVGGVSVLTQFLSNDGCLPHALVVRKDCGWGGVLEQPPLFAVEVQQVLQPPHPPPSPHLFSRTPSFSSGPHLHELYRQSSALFLRIGALQGEGGGTQEG